MPLNSSCEEQTEKFGKQNRETYLTKSYFAGRGVCQVERLVFSRAASAVAAYLREFFTPPFGKSIGVLFEESPRPFLLVKVADNFASFNFITLEMRHEKPSKSGRAIRCFDLRHHSLQSIVK